MNYRICIAAAALAVSAALSSGAASAATAVIHLNSPTNGDKVLAQEAEKGKGPPAQGLWTRTTVSVDPKTGAKTTVTIIASHPVPDPPAQITQRPAVQTKQH
jgi:hypothetical protein